MVQHVIEVMGQMEDAHGQLRMMKNVIVISFSFMLQFTAYNGVAGLQSSINAEDGLGTVALTAVTAGLIISSLFLPSVVIRCLGHKWTVVFCFLTYTPYVVAQIWPSFWTLVPTAFLLGLGAGPLWCAKCICLAESAKAYSKSSGVSTEVLMVRFMGIFYMIYQLNQVWGNLISSLILTSGENPAAITALNVTQILEICGANFLSSSDAGDALQKQPQHKIFLMMGVYTCCMVIAAVMVAFLLDPIKQSNEESKKQDKMSGAQLLVATLKLMMEPNQLLLIIINIFVGLEQSFFQADFTSAFISCAVGTGSIGFILMIYGVVDALSCFFAGYLVKITGRIPLMISACVVHSGLFLVLLLWRPQQSQLYILYIITVLWGMCDSVWMVIVNAYYGTLFLGRQEAAFANYRLWESVGFIIGYAMSPLFRTKIKTYIHMAFMYIGVASYLLVEYRERRAKVDLNKPS